MRRRRRRYFRRRPRQFRNLATLPEGVIVYARVRPDVPDPDRLPRYVWQWVCIERSTDQAAIVLLQTGERTKVSLQRCYIKATTGTWMHWALASIRKTTYWWWHDDHIESFRLATELEVALYAQGIIPHEKWRLFDEHKLIVDVPDGVKERVWCARPEPPSDEELAKQKEAARTKKRDDDLQHAKRMLAMWSSKYQTVQRRRNEWARVVKRIEKRVEKEKRP